MVRSTPEMGRNVRLGRFTLVRPLGAGGMAELYLARADGIEGFAMLCAVKRILPHRAQNERFVRMFLNEARLVAALNHPNIAHVHDIGREGGEYFFAMEYVHGQDLRHIVRAAPERRMRLENALHVAIGVCAGLHHAHEARDASGRPLGIVHRDVSPSNVLVSYQGSVKLVDFGVAKAASIESETREGVIKGKYGYMSPEQCIGEPLDRRSDIFNIGILLWEITTGRRLYKAASDLQTLHRVVYADALAPSRLFSNYPPDLEQIVMRALARDRDKRYQTAEELQLDLEAFAREWKLNVSAVAMAREMSELFRDQIDAWREAEEAGRSLAEHLAEASEDESLSSSDHDALDGLIGDLVTQVPIGEPATAHTAITVPPSPATALPGRSKRSPAVLALAVTAIGGAVAAGWGFGRRESAKDPAASPAGSAVVTEPEIDAEVVAIEPTADADVEAVAEVTDVAVVDEAVDAGVESSREPTATKKKKTRGSRERATARVIPKPAAPVTREPLEKTSSEALEPIPTTPPSPPPAAPPPAAPTGPKPGTVDPASVRATVRSHLPQIQACVARARMIDRDLKGRVVVEVRLAGSGAVTRATVKSSTGATETLEACFVGAVRGWAFSPPAGGTPGAFTYPFVF